ncbi:MAG: hypothetical protein BVN28_02425 [Nitrospira sp. ST-bin4]|nr:MAG: hypothetical protein BVN28_02425 [Nitrospira sp. ST-bin4]
MEGTARTLQGCVFDVKSLLTPIRKAGMFSGALAGYFLAGQRSIGVVFRTMAARQGKGRQTLIYELLG